MTAPTQQARASAIVREAALAAASFEQYQTLRKIAVAYKCNRVADECDKVLIACSERVRKAEQDLAKLEGEAP